MINTLLYQTFLFGNLELVYTRRKIKTIDIPDFIKIVKENKEEDLGHLWLWRIYKNYKFLFTAYENVITQNGEIAILFIELLEEINNLASSHKLFIDNIVTINRNKNNLALLILLRELEDRFKNISIFNENQIIRDMKDLFVKKFSFLGKYRHNIITHDYILPFEKTQWSPSWCVTLDDKQETLKGIDIYIDYYFLFHIIRFNKYMTEDISYLIDRMTFLKDKAPDYYNNFILNKVNDLSKNIFLGYPYKIIYEDYFEWAKKFDQVYLPPVLNYFNMDKITKNVWLLTILPRYLTAYLLGFPIISSDVPNDKNLSQSIEKVLDIGFDKYWQNLSENTEKIINLRSMGIICGNNIEKDKIQDLTYTSVNEYNLDDIFMLFNEGVFYVFTYPEFEDLIRNERNPYNRSNIPILAPLLSSIKFKKKVKRQLGYRYLDVDLNSTISENFNLIKEKIVNEIDLNSTVNNYHNFTNSLINMFLQHNYSS